MATSTQTMAGHDVFRARRFIGKDVFDVNGEHVGEVEDLVIGVQTGCAQWAIVSTGGVLGIGEKYRIVPIQAISIEMDTARLMLSFEGGRLQNGPRYDRDNPPDWSDENWKRSVRSFYGMETGAGMQAGQGMQGYTGYERRSGMMGGYTGPERRGTMAQGMQGRAGMRGRWQPIGQQMGQGRMQGEEMQGQGMQGQGMQGGPTQGGRM